VAVGASLGAAAADCSLGGDAVAQGCLRTWPGDAYSGHLGVATAPRGEEQCERDCPVGDKPEAGGIARRAVLTLGFTRKRSRARPVADASYRGIALARRRQRA
jgi:hypothetical protein